VRAQLKNSRLLPLTAPSVRLTITRDGLEQKTVSMPADASRPGRFVIQVPVLQPGEYRMELVVPETADERLTRSFRGVVPQLEKENPQRNASLLREIAQKSEGAYYDDLSVALSDTASPSLVDRLKDVSRTDTVPQDSDPEKKEEEKWLKWMLIALCGVLSLEWLVRRLMKLA